MVAEKMFQHEEMLRKSEQCNSEDEEGALPETHAPSLTEKVVTLFHIVTLLCNPSLS